jgi:hypothetical protein
MKKAQKGFKFLRISIPFILVFSLLPFFNLHYLLLRVFVSKPIIMLLIPTWFLAFLFSFKEEVFGFKVKKETREKTFFYAIFVTFIVFYLVFFSGNLPLIVAQTSTTTTTTIQCKVCSPDGSGTCYDPQSPLYGKCTQSCGSEPACEGVAPGDICGKDARCTFGCKCCYGSDSDGGINYLEAGTTTGIYSLGSWYYAYCETEMDECFYGWLIEYYLVDNGKLYWEYHNCSDDPINKVCIDGHCGCTDNSHCPGYDPNTHLKYYCDARTHTCQTLKSCVDNTECEDGWCCDKLVGGTGSCKQKGNITSYGGKSYICDPPEGFVSSSSENANIQTSKKLTLLDLLVNPFSYFFKK